MRLLEQNRQGNALLPIHVSKTASDDLFLASITDAAMSLFAESFNDFMLR